MAREFHGKIPRVPIDADTSKADAKIDRLFQRIDGLKHIDIDANVNQAQRRLETMVKRTNEQMSKELISTMTKDMKTVLRAMKSEYENLGDSSSIYKNLEKTCNMVEDRFSNLTITVNKKSLSGLENILNNVSELQTIDAFSFDVAASKQVVKNTEVTFSTIKAARKEINSIAGKVDYIQKALSKGAKDGFSTKKLEQYRERIQGLEQSLQSFYSIDDELIQNALVNAAAKINDVLGEIDIKMPKVKTDTDVLSTGEVLKNLGAVEKKTKAIQEVVSRISKNSSIAATKSMEDMAHEAVNVTKVLAGMYDEGITDTERYITLQYKLKKLFDAMGKSYGGLKSSGAKNGAELLDLVIDGIVQRTGVNLFSDSGYAGVMENLFGDADLSVFNKSLSGLGMKHIAEMLLSWGGTGDWVDMQKQVIAEVEKTDDATKELGSSIEQTAKTQLRTQEQINTELDNEIQKLKEIEDQERRNEAAREYFKKKQANYGKEVLGVDHAVYDTDLLKGAAKELNEFNELLETRNKFQEKYIKLCNIIEKYYVNDKPGKYSIGNGVYKNLDDFFDINPDMKHLEKLSENGQKTTNKTINELFKNIVKSLKSDRDMVATLLASGEVSGALVGQDLDREEVELNRERQRLYDARIAQENKVGALKREELDLIVEQGKEEAKNSAARIKSSKVKVREFVNMDEYSAHQDKYRDEHDGESEYLENVVDIVPRIGKDFNRISADMTTSCKKAETAVKRFFSVLDPEKYPELAEWQGFIEEGMQNGLFSQSDAIGGWSWEVQALDDNTYYVSVIAVTDALLEQTAATEKLAEARLKLTPKNDGSGEYTAMDGKYEIGQDAEGWKVFQRDNAGLLNLIGTYKHFEDIKNDVSLLTREEIVRTDEVIQEIKTLQETYQSLRTEMGGYMPLANKYIEVLDKVKNGAMSAADAIGLLNEVTGVKGLSSAASDTIARTNAMAEFAKANEEILLQNHNSESFMKKYEELAKGILSGDMGVEDANKQLQEFVSTLSKIEEKTVKFVPIHQNGKETAWGGTEDILAARNYVRNQNGGFNLGTRLTVVGSEEAQSVEKLDKITKQYNERRQQTQAILDKEKLTLEEILYLLKEYNQMYWKKLSNPHLAADAVNLEADIESKFGRATKSFAWDNYLSSVVWPVLNDKKVDEQAYNKIAEKIVNQFGVEIPQAVEKTTEENKKLTSSYEGLAAAQERELSKMTFGNSGETLAGTNPINFKYAVMSVEDLIMSHDAYGNVNSNYPEELQPRDRSRMVSRTQIEDIVKNIMPELLVASPTAQNGSPIVNNDGIVVGGNARSAALLKAYEVGRADGYKSYITEHASEFGLDPNNMPKNPVLVRVVDIDGGLDVLAKQLNESTTAGYSAAEQAIVNEELIMKVISKLNIDESANLNSEANRDFVKSFISLLPENQKNEMMTKDGSLSAVGLVKVKQALASAAYGSKEMLENLEQISPELLNISNALMAGAAKAANARYAVESGELNDFGVVSTLLNGVDLLKTARHNNQSIEEYMNQLSLFGSDYSAEDIAIGKFLEANIRNATQLKNMVDMILDSAMDAGDPNQISFDGMSATTLSDLIRSAFTRYASEYQKDIDYDSLISGHLPAEIGSRSDKRVDRIDAVDNTIETIKEENKLLEEQVETEEKIAEEANKAADAKERQAEATEKSTTKKRRKSALLDDDEGKERINIIQKAVDDAIEQLRDAENNINEKLKIDLSKIESPDDLNNQIGNLVTAALGTDLSIGVIDINKDIAAISLYNEELGVTTQQIWQLEQAAEGADKAQLKFISADRLRVNLKQAQKYAEAQKKALNDSEKHLLALQSRLNTQSRSYQHGSKKLKGDSALLLPDATTLEDSVDKTLDSLVQHIQSRIDDAKGKILTDAQKNAFTQDLVALENEIKIQQADRYKSGTMSPTEVTELRKILTATLDTIASKAKKNNVFDDISESYNKLKANLNDPASEGYFKDDKISDAVQKIRTLQAETTKAVAEEGNLKSVLALQEKLYNSKRKLAELNLKGQFDTSEALKAKRLTDELQAQYDASVKLISNQEQLTQLEQHRAALQQELTAAINEQQQKINQQHYTSNQYLGELVPYDYTNNGSGGGGGNGPSGPGGGGPNDPNRIKEQYQSILNLINEINEKNTKISSYQRKDAGSGVLSGYITPLQKERKTLINELNGVKTDVNNTLGDFFLQGQQEIKLPLATSIGTDVKVIEEFLNSARVQAVLTKDEINALVSALSKAQDIDINFLGDEISENKERIKQIQKENQYFSDKQAYSSNLKIEDIQKLGSASSVTKEQLEGMAQAIAQNSEGAVVLSKNFSMGADGIARLDFSVFDTNTGSIKNFTAALGTATGQMSVFETTTDKTVKTAQAASNQIAKSQKALASFGFGDVGLNDANAPKQVTDILNQINVLKGAVESGDANFITESIKELDVLTKSFEKAGNQAQKMRSAIDNGQATGLGEIDPKGNVYKQLIQKAQQYASTQSNATLEIGRFDQATNTLNTSLIHANGTVEQIKVSMYGLHGEVAAQQAGVGKLTTTWDRFKASIGQAGKQLMTAFAGYNVFYKAISEVRKGIGYVKEIDLALTELKKVTDETEESYAKFLNTAAGTAGEIGSTVSDFTEASANFARLGYTMEESANMAKTAIVYRNVADGLDTVDEATDSIISTMKAFGIESNNTMGIIDVFNEVGNNFAITSAGIGEAMQRSASALYESGNTFEESVALITAANSVIQNPEQVGTALKTLALRLRGAKVELEEAGLETDSMAESTSKLQDQLKALTHGKVDIMLDEDTFKNPTEILREMADAWEDMTDIESAAALELMGGKRQANILASIIKNFDVVEDVIETSMNSSGSAIAENEKYMDSIAGKSEQLTNAMQALWNDTISSDMIKYFLDVALGVTKVVDAFSPWLSALAGVLVYFKAFKNIGPISLLKDLFADIKNYAAVIQQVNSISLGPSSTGVQNINALANAVSGLSAKQQAAILTSQGFSKAQTAQVLAQNKVEQATIRQIVGQEALNASKVESISMTGAEISAQLAEQGVTLSATAAKWLEDHATEELTRDKLAAAGATGQEIMALLGLTGAASTATVSIKGLVAAMWTMMKSNPVGWIMMLISGITMLISKFKQAREEVVQAAEQSVNTYQEAQKTLKEQKKTIDELSASYERLSRGVDLDTNNNLNLTTDSYKEYLNICNEIADMYPHLVTGYDTQGNAILSLKGNVDELIQAYKEAAQLARQQMIAGGKDVFDTFKTNYDTETFWGIDETGIKQQKELAENLLNVINAGTNDEIIDYITPILNLKMSDKKGSVSHSDLKDLMKSAGIDKFYSFNWGTMGYNIDIESLKEQLPKLNAYIKSTTTLINTETSKVKSLLSAYLGEDLDYASYSDKTRAYIDNIISGLDAEFIGGFDSADALYNHIKTNIIDVFKAPEVTDALSDLSELQLKFADGDIVYSDYRAQLAEHLSKIQNKFDEDSLAQIKVGLGVDEESLQTAINHIYELIGSTDIRDPRRLQISELSVEDIQLAGQLEVPEGTIYSWEDLTKAIEQARIAATKDFDITNYTDAITAHSAAISEYQEALQKLDKGSFTMDDFMSLVKKYPELAKGVDISSNAFHGLAHNLNGAIKTSTKSFIKDLQKLKASLDAAGKSTESVDQLIESIENMSLDALDDTIQKYGTLADAMDRAKTSNNKLLASMEENPNENYENRGDAMDYMKEAMKKGEIGSESNLWNVAKNYGFTYDSAKTMNENADALAKFIAVREKWFAKADDGDDRTKDGYSFKGIENYIETVESVVSNSPELQKLLEWDYDENTGVFDSKYDNKNLKEIVSLLGETESLVGLTESEFLDLMKQIGQYFDVKWSNYNDAANHLNDIANSAKDAKTKVEEYQKYMQEYFGKNTEIDLTTRPMVSAEKMQEAGWEGFEEGDYATVHSKGYSNEDESVFISVTPILPDGEVLDEKTLSQYAEEIANGADPAEVKIEHNGKTYTGEDIFLNKFEGPNAKEQEAQYGTKLSEAQAGYDQLRDTLGINATLADKGVDGLKEIDKLQGAISTNSKGATIIDEKAFTAILEEAGYAEDQIDLIIEKIKTLNGESFTIDKFNIDKALDKNGIEALTKVKELQDAIKKDAETGFTTFDADMFTSVLKEAGYTDTKIKELIKTIQECDAVVSVSGSEDPLGLNSANKNAETLQATLNLLGIEYSAKKELFGDGINLDINVNSLITTLSEKGWTDEQIKSYLQQLSSDETSGVNIKIDGKVSMSDEEIDAAIKKSKEIPEEETTKYEVTGDGVNVLGGIENKWASITKDKITNYTINEKTVRTTETSPSSYTTGNNGSVSYNNAGTYGEMSKTHYFDPVTRTWKRKYADGTAHVSGTAFADGNWGVPKTESALVGELGPELLVRNGRWTTVGENGAEFTQVKKGDIIFNHKQTESLLKNGYVTSRGKAYAGGTAYSSTDSTVSFYDFSGTGGYTKYDVNDNVVDSWGDLSGAIDKASKSASDAKDEFEETFDWIEVRLEEINEQLDLMNAQLENAGDHASKNNIIDQIMGVNTNKMANLTAGIQKYSDYTASLLANVPAQYREAAQDGAIAITEFVGEADEKTVEAIEKYREWAQKVADLKQELEGVKTELRDLAIQKIDNIQSFGDAKTSIEDAQTEKLQNRVDLDEEMGLITSSAYYTAMMENSGKKISYWLPLLDNMQKEFDDAVKSGHLKVGTTEWYEQLAKLYEVQSEIDTATIELEEFQNAINDIYWDNFDELINRLGYLKDETQSLIDLMDNEDMVITPETEDGWSADQVEWTKEGMASLGLYAQQMEIAEYEAKQYAEAIDDLTAGYKKGLYSESEYLEKLNELKEGQYDSIEAYHDAQDAIVECNKARVDAIKEGIEKEIEAYEKLIEKKKEELDSEKDLYDFQKKVSESSKNIADIQRKIAALSGDNSASAIAQRKKLEAELAEAKADQEEMYYERSIENQQNALDRELENFQEEKDAEVERWEEYLTNIEQVVADSLNVVQANATEIGNTLTEKAEEYNLTVSDAVLSPWKDGAIAVSDYQTAFGTSMSSTMDQLDLLKDKWQAVIDKMAEAGKIDVSNINTENAQYAAAEKTPDPKPAAKPTPNNNKAQQTKAAPSVGGTVTVKKSATHFGSKSKGLKMASFVPGGSYTVYQTSGDQVLIGRNGVYTGWVKLTDLNGYAKGTTGVDEDQWALLDELGEELVLNAGPDGRLQYLSKGTAVLTHDLTERLMDLAMNPQEVLDRSRPQIAPNKSVVNNNMEIHIDASVGELIHVDRLEGNNLDEINKFVDKAWDKKMQGLNNSLKKFVR